MGFMKLNFDGSNRNNPGLALYGRVFRDCKGRILRFFAGSLETERNNPTKLYLMLKGIRMANDEGYNKIRF